MGKLRVPLENTLSGLVFHPETLRLDSPVGVDHLQRVDHPCTARLEDGDPTLGWEGDARLCLYLNYADRRWVLIRLENDGEYRVVTVSPPDQVLNEAEIAKLIMRLVAHDSRRGVDVKAMSDAHNAQVKAAVEAEESEKREKLAEKLAWGIQKDLGHIY